MSVIMLERVDLGDEPTVKKSSYLSSPRPSPSALSFVETRIMTSSSSPMSTDHDFGASRVGDSKGKTRERGFSVASTENVLSTSSTTSHAVNPTFSHRTLPLSRSKTPPTSPKRSRGSLFTGASDALGFKFGKRRSVRHKPLAQTPRPIILPGVIEITAPRPDAEEEERQQLRDAAAQAIGLTSSLLQPDLPPSNDPQDDDDRDYVHVPQASEPSETASTPISPHLSPFSIIPSPMRAYNRPSSHSRTSSIAPTPVPPFPSSPAELLQFTQASAMLPKYHPPSSLRFLTLSKTWKTRYLALTQPLGLATVNSSPTVAYLHLFKSSEGSDKELERLEINEDSVVFVAEEDVGTRRQVVKVGGTDVGALKKELNPEEGGRTMWFLQICEQAEASKWITLIKQSIFGQRAVRAGLGSPANFANGVEPRGDIDVMLSMRAQGIVNSPTHDKLNVQDFSASRTSPTEQPASGPSSRSTRSTSNASKPCPSGAVSTLKGLFTGNARPRSGSTRSTVESHIEDGSLASPMSASTSDFAMAIPVIRPQELDRKIISDEELAASSPRIAHPFGLNSSRDRATRALSVGAMPLQPPPGRKRWTAIGAPPSDASPYGYVNGNNGNHGENRVSGEYAPNPLGSGLFGTPDTKPREPSILSVSTLGSMDGGSTSTRRSSSVKRWSRQLPLPQRLTPPNGPPPDIPVDQDQDQLPHMPHPYANDRSPSRDSSIRSAKSGRSVITPFSLKRTSGSSVNTSSTSNSVSPVTSHARPGASHRISHPPPPCPAPTSALPPAPTEEGGHFRKSAASRSFRLSLMAPKPPPTMAPPPPPDDLRSRRRSGGTAKSILAPIPSSPTPSLSPLRPQSASTTPPPTTSTPTTTNTTSLKQRLRILSAPSPIYFSQPKSPLTPTPPLTPTITSDGEMFSYEQSYLNLYTPITPTTPRIHVPSSNVDDEPVFRSLSPPPRRISKQLAAPTAEKDKDRERGRERAPEDIPLPASARGSVVSLGLFAM